MTSEAKLILQYGPSEFVAKAKNAVGWKITFSERLICNTLTG